MNSLDLLIFLLLIGNVVLGYMFGLVRRLFVLGGLFAGVGAATLTSASLSGIVGSTFNIQSPLWAHVVTYAAMVVITVLLFEILGASYDRWIKSMIAPFADRPMGMLAGVVLGAFEVALLLIVGVGLVNASLPSGYAYPPQFNTMQMLFAGSFLAPHFYGLEPLTRTLFSVVLPASVGQYFSQLLLH